MNFIPIHDRKYLVCSVCTVQGDPTLLTLFPMFLLGTLVPEVNYFAYLRNHLQHIVACGIYQVSLAIFISNGSFLLNEQLCLGQS